MIYENVNIPNRPLYKPEEFAAVFYKLLETSQEVDQDKEHFWVAGLTTRRSIKYIDLVSLGSLNSAIAHPRETFRTAILKAVDHIFLCHNHPSGGLDPSSEDIRLTRKLVDAGNIIDIKVLDHVIIGNGCPYDNFYSLRESGKMPHTTY